MKRRGTKLGPKGFHKEWNGNDFLTGYFKKSSLAGWAGGHWLEEIPMRIFVFLLVAPFVKMTVPLVMVVVPLVMGVVPSWSVYGSSLNSTCCSGFLMMLRDGKILFWYYKIDRWNTIEITVRITNCLLKFIFKRKIKENYNRITRLWIGFLKPWNFALRLLINVILLVLPKR